jgi:heptosyltransferase-2
LADRRCTDGLARRAGAVYNGLMSCSADGDHPEPRRILLVLPSWVGDVVLATPAIDAIRKRFPQAHIVGVMKPGLAEILAGSPWLDEEAYWTAPAGNATAKRGLWSLAVRLRHEPIDLAVLFPNSLRAALLGRLAGARRRVGYAREGRSPLLTDRIPPERENGAFKPVPVLDYYNRLAEHAGTAPPAKLPTLFTTADEEARLEAFVQRAGVRRDRPWVVLNPGGQYGAAKLWMPQRYAAVADALREKLGAEVFINVGPQETAIAQEVLAAARGKLHSLADSGLRLGGLKALVRRAALMITNDTGPRHFAIAFGVPLVTIFGPTHTEWTQTMYRKERIVRVEVDCGPCQKKVCPLDLRCMTQISEAMVLAAAEEVMAAERAEPCEPRHESARG